MHTHQNTSRSFTRPCSLSPPGHSHDLHNQMATMAAAAGLAAAGHAACLSVWNDALLLVDIPATTLYSLTPLRPCLSHIYTHLSQTHAQRQRHNHEEDVFLIIMGPPGSPARALLPAAVAGNHDWDKR